MDFAPVSQNNPDQILYIQLHYRRVVIQMDDDQTGAVQERLLDIERNFLFLIIQQAERSHCIWDQAHNVHALLTINTIYNPMIILHINIKRNRY